MTDLQNTSTLSPAKEVEKECKQEEADNCGPNATPYLRNDVSKIPDKEEPDNIEKEPLIYYQIMQYELRKHRWFMWPILSGCEVAVITWWFLGNLKTYKLEFYNYTFIILYICSALAMFLQFAKSWTFERYKHRFPIIAGHERQVICTSWSNKTPKELTKSVHLMYGVLECG